MDNKRKASSSGAGIADGDDRAPKRLKTPGQPSDYNLMQGESPESTTAYGLHFLETIRRTKDKSGRLVANYFENLLPKEGNKEYYERIRMPISLKIIERKLHNQDFKNLSELESFFKRMVTNAKEFYPKNSEIFEDAERVRKALSNYMTKTNPAYKLIPNYSCQATPFPEDVQPESEEHSGVAAAAAAAEGVEGEDEDAEGDEDAEDDEEDVEGEDDEGDEEEDGNPRRIVLKRKGPGRPPRAGSEQARKLDKSGRVKADHEYEGVPYKGLSFQQAQEKIVEELIRKPDGTDPYFLDFINLPPRSYKDYFAVITSPLSLKGLQKLVKGIHGRQPATGVSDFKSWAAFEEKASLLWTNAHFYNEEGSEIYTLATELKECFEKELNEAKAVVQEPPQPKIKLKMTPGQETPVLGPKKITIHVGGSRGSAAASPAPQTGQSSDAGRPDGTIDVNRTVPLPAANTTAASFQLDNARMPPGAAASPRPPTTGPVPSVGAQQPPAVFQRPNGNVPGVMNGPNGMAPVHNYQQPFPGPQLQNGHPHPPPAPAPAPAIYDYKYRAPGRGYADSLLPSVLIRTHPSVAGDHRFRLEIPAHPKEAHQNLTLHVPGHHHRLQLIPRLPPFESEGRQYRLFVTVNGNTVGRAAPLPVPDDPLPATAIVFDINLQHTTNVVTVTVIASLPKGQKLPNGADCEVEKLVLNLQLLRLY